MDLQKAAVGAAVVALDLATSSEQTRSMAPGVDERDHDLTI